VEDASRAAASGLDEPLAEAEATSGEDTCFNVTWHFESLSYLRTMNARKEKGRPCSRHGRLRRYRPLFGSLPFRDRQTCLERSEKMM
jgi:hypothetical protein